MTCFNSKKKHPGGTFIANNYISNDFIKDIFKRIYPETFAFHIYRAGGKAPKFLEKPSIQQQGSKVVMSVLVEAAPEPVVQWFKSSVEVKSSTRIVISTQKGSIADSYLLLCEITVSKLIIFLFKNI